MKYIPKWQEPKGKKSFLFYSQIVFSTFMRILYELCVVLIFEMLFFVISTMILYRIL